MQITPQSITPDRAKSGLLDFVSFAFDSIFGSNPNAVEQKAEELWISASEICSDYLMISLTTLAEYRKTGYFHDSERGSGRGQKWRASKVEQWLDTAKPDFQTWKRIGKPVNESGFPSYGGSEVLG